MRILNCNFKNVRGIKIITAAFEAVYLAEYGGKLVSLKDLKHNTEWLAQDKNPKYIPQFIGGNYVDCEVSGADEMFPTIDLCRCNNVEYPCHGEVCRVPHKCEISDDTLIMSYKSDLLGYEYKKHISEGENGAIRCRYEIKNLNSEDFACIWALHLMFAAEEKGMIFAQFCENPTVEFMFDDRQTYGKRGTKSKLKKEYLISSQYKKNGDAYKFYITNPIKNGVCGYYRNSRAGGIRLKYDAEKLPYLGIWINNGGFKNTHTAAVEPCNIPFDSVTEAKKRGYAFNIKPNEVFSFEISIEKADI